MPSETYYSDYPTKPIGGSNPYHCCAHCDRSVPEINGDLKKHERHCAYRIQKEAEFVDGIPLTMANVMQYIKDNLTINITASRVWGIEVDVRLADELVCSDTANFPEDDND